MPHPALPRLRFMTCGSVDNGKSTLIGRLLFDCKAVYEDHLNEAGKASNISVGGDPEFAFLVDGLKAEREQGITIDVAYRYFSTSRRSFIIADAPGHEQYTRNQAAAASQSDVAIVVISAQSGILPQTRRHMHIAALFGVQSLIIVVNKMDMAGYAHDVFTKIEAEITAFAQHLNIGIAAIIPISAKLGDNLAVSSPNMPWYSGTTVLEVLEQWHPAENTAAQPLYFPVQMAVRDEKYGRVYLGTVASGTIEIGMKVTTIGAGKSKIAQLWKAGVESRHAQAGDAIAIALEKQIDAGRGAVICAKDHVLSKISQVRASMVGLADIALQQGREYDIMCGTASSSVSLTKIEGVINLETAQLTAGATHFANNEIVSAQLTFTHPIACTTFANNKTLGAFILIDKVSNITLAAGVINEITRLSETVPWQELTITPKLRSHAMGQTPFVLWFTGLSGAGKTTIAGALEQRLFALGKRTYILDGDNLRHGLTADLSFTMSDRIENMRRVAHTSKLFLDAGVITLVSLISPFEAERQNAKAIIGAENFCEVFVDTPLDVCQQRDPKNLYKKVKAGEIQNFTGISAGYEAPKNADIKLKSAEFSVEELVAQVVGWLEMKGWV